MRGIDHSDIFRDNVKDKRRSDLITEGFIERIKTYEKNNYIDDIILPYRV